MVETAQMVICMGREFDVVTTFKATTYLPQRLYQVLRLHKLNYIS